MFDASLTTSNVPSNPLHNMCTWLFGTDLCHPGFYHSWWRHQMETFSALLAVSAGNSPVTGEFPAQRPVTRSVDVFFDLRLNTRLSNQWWGWWFETPSRPLWRHCNVLSKYRRQHCAILYIMRQVGNFALGRHKVTSIELTHSGLLA